MLLLSLLLAVPVPPGALLDQAPQAAIVARGRPPSEPVRGMAEYLGALTAFTLVNAAGSALLSDARVTVGHHSWSVDNTPAVAGAGACFALSPLAAALASYFIGRTSDSWSPSLGWAAVGAYGTALVAVAGGVGLASVNVDRSTAMAANTALYLAIPLGTVLVQNATKLPMP
jgi:hypothetical protein